MKFLVCSLSLIQPFIGNWTIFTNYLNNHCISYIAAQTCHVNKISVFYNFNFKVNKHFLYHHSLYLPAT
ncbi:unnamed protein product [Rhizophagus irregularis]|uniref:Uncharacterized protein n=1 Tax=Rhizophagus irregularis TaxID=588596 RepID=A0A915ZWQ1_9GLOM|nr:unnamed protein product [Rhizophagus irregularis]CAB5163339.1 unnamed protein product [Rhizophagus irregularis]CAB5380149.1 unnamed protein product [Rhizophagus irregularis]CAB5393994.1 unnamed protein product [Rhizophagus irregularis]